MDLGVVLHVVELALIILVGWLGKSKLQEIHLTMNSRLDLLLHAHEQVGAERERVEQRAREAEQAKGVADRESQL